jgi:hypothetical protein
MRQINLPALLAALTVILSPSLASAQAGAPEAAGPAYGLPGIEVVLNTLSSRGFWDVEVVGNRGHAYTVVATAPRGNRVHMTVDGRTGIVSDVRATHWQPFATGFENEPIFYPIK